EHVEEIQEKGEATVKLAGRAFTIRKDFIEDINQQQQSERIHKLRRPLLVMHSPLDRTVSVDNATGIFQAALHPKSFVSLDRADHLLTRENDARYAAGVIAAWAGRYIEAPAMERAVEDAAEDGAVHVTERGTGAFAVAIEAGRHSWLGDEPASVGGDDLGPNPYQMLTAAL